MVDASRLSFLDVYDLYSLVGNALSNAIEATSKVEDGKAKYITFIVKGTEKYTSIHIENPFVGQVIMEHNLPITNKQDKGSHGFGVKSMKNIVSKYDGKVTLTVKDNIFNVDILFNR
jgi:sensor histidine kinase regulating citrate/malate metabolism